MKSVFKLIGIIALTALIVVSLVTCSNGTTGNSTFRLIVRNEFENPIERIHIGLSVDTLWDRDGLNITQGRSQTFTIDMGSTGYVRWGHPIGVYAENLPYGYNMVSDEFISGGTYRYTLGVDGLLNKN